MLSEEIIQLRHTLHKYPELSCREEKTIETLKCFIKEHTDLEIISREGWFYALYRTEAHDKRPPIAFRADMDALPMEETLRLPYASVKEKTAHKCGHDGHSAALAGFACILGDLKPDRDVYLIFQHGEEIGAGGEACSAIIGERGISEIYACHNWSGFPQGQILVKEGVSQCASQGLAVRFKGVPSHASQPENGKNPCAALAELALYTQSLAGAEGLGDRDELILATVVGMRAGGENYGMSASEGEVYITLRAERQSDMESLCSAIVSEAERLSAENGLSVSFRDCDVFPETECDKDCAGKAERCAKKLSLTCARPERPFRASEDFGHYLKKCPGAMFYVGNGTDYPEIHTGAYDFNDKNLEVIMKMFAALCMEK